MHSFSLGSKCFHWIFYQHKNATQQILGTLFAYTLSPHVAKLNPTLRRCRIHWHSATNWLPPIRIEHHKLHQPTGVKFYITRVSTQPQLSVTSFKNSRPWCEILLGSRVCQACYNFSQNIGSPNPTAPTWSAHSPTSSNQTRIVHCRSQSSNIGW